MVFLFDINLLILISTHDVVVFNYYNCLKLKVELSTSYSSVCPYVCIMHYACMCHVHLETRVLVQEAPRHSYVL